MAGPYAYENLRSSWGWLALLGVISLIGGLLALANPFAATLTAEFLAAWTFTLFGVVQIIQAFRLRGNWGVFLWALLLGVLTFAVGISLLVRPMQGIISLTMLVAIVFLVLGAVKLMYSFTLRPLSGWGWVLASGILSLVLGVMILADLPWAAATVLGILLAIELLSNGIFLLILAFGLRSMGSVSGQAGP